MRIVWDVLDIIGHSNICIRGILGGEEKEKVAENIFEEIVTENFFN